MVVHPLYYKVAGQYVPLTGYGYSVDKKQVIRTQPQPTTVPPPSSTTTTTRSFDLPLGQVTGKKPFGFRLGDMMVRGDGYVTFNPDHIVLSGAAPRLYVYDEPKAKRWKNVEIVVEYMRVSENSPLPSYAGIGIGVRSIHEQQTATKLVVPTYYCKHTFDGRFFFEKEHKHNSSYTKRPSTSVAMKPNTWYTMNFKVTTPSVLSAKLEASLNGHSIIYTDIGNWDNNDPIKEGVSCFIRNDSVKDFRVRKFSIREIA